MARIELVGLRSTRLSWEQLGEALEPALEPLGLTPGGGDVAVELLDRREQGRVVMLTGSALARRAALSLAKRSGSPIAVFEVTGTSGPNRCKFKTVAWEATPAGELKTAEGAELDLEDPGGWVGDLSDQAHQVLEAFARFEMAPLRSETKTFKKRKPGRPSTPRVAALFASLQKAKSHEMVPQPDGRVELRIELATGGKQKSYCSTAECEELQRLVGG